MVTAVLAAGGHGEVCPASPGPQGAGQSGLIWKGADRHQVPVSSGECAMVPLWINNRGGMRHPIGADAACRAAGIYALFSSFLAAALSIRAGQSGAVGGVSCRRPVAGGCGKVSAQCLRPA